MADDKVKPVVVKPIKPTVDEEDYGPTPPDIKDKLQTMKNEKAAEQYQKTRKFAKGGTASSRADGCAQRGKTRGKMV